VENRIKIGSAIALIVLGGIYGMSNKSNNRKQMPSLMENGG
jgi:hypothetical protein